MEEDQLIEELLLEASNSGIREDVIELSNHYMNAGYDKLNAMQLAFDELMDSIEETWDDADDDDDWPDIVDDWDTFTEEE